MTGLEQATRHSGANLGIQPGSPPSLPSMDLDGWGTPPLLQDSEVAPYASGLAGGPVSIDCFPRP